MWWYEQDHTPKVRKARPSQQDLDDEEAIREALLANGVVTVSKGSNSGRAASRRARRVAGAKRRQAEKATEVSHSHATWPASRPDLPCCYTCATERLPGVCLTRGWAVRW